MWTPNIFGHLYRLLHNLIICYWPILTPEMPKWVKFVHMSGSLRYWFRMTHKFEPVGLYEMLRQRRGQIMNSDFTISWWHDRKTERSILDQEMSSSRRQGRVAKRRPRKSQVLRSMFVNWIFKIFGFYGKTVYVNMSYIFGHFMLFNTKL